MTFLRLGVAYINGVTLCWRTASGAWDLFFLFKTLTS